MKVIKKSVNDIPKEDAHQGADSRKLYIDDKQSPSERVQGMTHGWLPAGKVFGWHNHEAIEEIMFVLLGNGEVSDKDGTYPYEKGDVFIFPAGIEHKIANPTQDTHEFVFIRVYE